MHFSNDEFEYFQVKIYKTEQLIVSCQISNSDPTRSGQFWILNSGTSLKFCTLKPVPVPVSVEYICVSKWIYQRLLKEFSLYVYDHFIVSFMWVV